MKIQLVDLKQIHYMDCSLRAIVFSRTVRQLLFQKVVGSSVYIIVLIIRNLGGH